MPEKTFYYNIIPEERKELPLVNAISGYSIAGKPDSPQSNNDGFYIDEATGIVIVCDGAGDRVYTKDTVQIVLNTYRNILEDSRKYGKIGDALPTIPPKTITDAKTFALLGVSYASQDLQGFFESLSRFIKFEQMAMATTIALEMEVDDTIFTAHAGDSRIIVEYRDGTIRQTVDESAAYMAQEVGLLNAVQATRIDTILSNGITEADFNRCVLPNGDTRLADTADEADYWQWRDDGVWVKPFRLERQCLSNYITAPSLAYQGLHLTYNQFPARGVSAVYVVTDGITDNTTPTWLIDDANEMRQNGLPVEVITQNLVLHTRLNAINRKRYGGSVDDATLVYKQFKTN